MVRSNIPSAPLNTAVWTGVTSSAGELNYNDISAAGTVQASKTVVVDGNKDIGDFRNLDAVNIDAGASGTAGTVDVFPSTASKGKLAITASDAAGDTTTTITTASMAGARTYTIPDVLASTNFMMGKQGAVARTASADGTGTGTIADAGPYQFISVTSAGANNIIILPTPTPGTVIELAVAANGYELRTSAPATISINGGAGADAESAIPANSLARVVCTSATTWLGYTITGTTLASMEAAA